MVERSEPAHPYMANSAAPSRAAMLEAVGAPSVDALFEQIPPEHVSGHDFDLGRTLASEVEIGRHLRDLLAANRPCEPGRTFLGAGCWQHHVPAICDEIASRSEFITSVWGTPSSDHGRNQAWFEFASQLGELLELDFVGLPVYSWGAALGNAVRMAARLTGRDVVLVPEFTDPERLRVAGEYCGAEELGSHIRLRPLTVDPATGTIDRAALAEALSSEVAAVYVEVPSYLGRVEPDVAAIADAVHAAGGELIVGVDPISLGVLEAPGRMGADIVIGTTQTLGIHMHGGGGVGGFIAARDDERYAREFPTLQVSAAPTSRPDELGFGLTLFAQSSYGSREDGKDWTGNSVYLWTIVNAVFMSALGPAGFREVGDAIVRRSRYAAGRLDALDGVRVVWPVGFFREFVVDLTGTGRSVADVNAALAAHGIVGGRDLGLDFDRLRGSMLVCVTELHTRDDIDDFVGVVGSEVGR